MQSGKDMLETFQSPIVRDYELMVEYKRLKTSAPSGVYVVPSFNSLRTWYGFIIVHQGWYKGGTFKFQLNVPDDYPGSPPTIRFLSRVYHPFVHQKTMNMHLGWAVKRWVGPPKHNIHYVLKRLKKMFYITDFAKYPAIWPIAKKLSQTDRPAFLAKAQNSVKQSLEPSQLYSPPEKGASIKFSAPNRAHRIFFENYCHSRGIEIPAPLVSTNGGASAFMGRTRSETQEDDAIFRDARTHGAAKKNTPSTVDAV